MKADTEPNEQFSNGYGKFSPHVHDKHEAVS